MKPMKPDPQGLWTNNPIVGGTLSPFVYVSASFSEDRRSCRNVREDWERKKDSTWEPKSSNTSGEAKVDQSKHRRLTNDRGQDCVGRVRFGMWVIGEREERVYVVICGEKICVRGWSIETAWGTGKNVGTWEGCEGLRVGKCVKLEGRVWDDGFGEGRMQNHDKECETERNLYGNEWTWNLGRMERKKYVRVQKMEEESIVNEDIA